MGDSVQMYMCRCYDSCLDCPAGAIKYKQIVCAFSLVKDAKEQYIKDCGQLFVKKEWMV